MKRIFFILLVITAISTQLFASNSSYIQCKDLNNTQWTSDYASINMVYFFCGFKPTVQFSVQKNSVTAIMELKKIKGPQACDEIPTVFHFEGSCNDGQMYPLIIYAKDTYIRAWFEDDRSISFSGSMLLSGGKIDATLQTDLHQS